jgi:exopolysaccharide biosynthesis polyprenyl glycosylphosphotransferase
MATFSRTFIRLAISLVVIGMFNGLIFYFYQTIYIGRVVFVLQLIIFFILSATGKFFMILRGIKKEDQTELILLNFTDEEKQNFQEEPGISNTFHLVHSQVSNQNELSSFIEKLDKKAIVVISSSSTIIDDHIDTFISLKFNEYNIYDMKTFFVNITGKIPSSTFGEIWTIISENEFVMGINAYYKIKRVIDVILSIFHLIVLSPFFLILPILIKLTSRGPVLFTQERLGWNKKPFKVIKFRSMKINAEAKTGPKWASENDPRITRVGKIMRKTRLDELPQLINVLKGEMSFVGNRPIRAHFAEILTKHIPYYDLRFMIKPGLTGWSQVKLNYPASIEGQIEKFKYELYYLKNMSFLLDMIIFVKTVKTVLGMNGN